MKLRRKYVYILGTLLCIVFFIFVSWRSREKLKFYSQGEKVFGREAKGDAENSLYESIIKKLEVIQ